jgi:hypothetical protein
MKKYRFEDLCKKAEEGYTVTVSNPAENQSADVLSCSLDKMNVYTSGAEHKSWDFRECQEITSRPYPQDDKLNGFSDQK